MHANTQGGLWEQVLGLEAKTLLGVTAAHMGVLGLRPGSISDASCLPMHALGGGMWWLKYFYPRHPHDGDADGVPGFWPQLSWALGGMSQQMEDLSVSVSTPQKDTCSPLDRAEPASSAWDLEPRPPRASPPWRGIPWDWQWETHTNDRGPDS